MQQDLDTHASILKLVFETVAIDFHFSQTHDGLVVEPVVSGLDFAAVLHGLWRRFAVLLRRVERQAARRSSKQAGFFS